MPVPGECSAAIARACGSTARSRRRRAGAGRLRRWRDRGAQLGRGTPAARRSVARISLPQRSCAIARASQYSYSSARSVDAQSRLQRARPVVDARVDHARAVAGLVRRQLLLALEHAQRRARMPACQLARDGRARRCRRRRPPSHSLGGAGRSRQPAAVRLRPATAPVRRAPWPPPRRPGRRRTALRRRRHRACAPSRAGARRSAPATGCRPSTPLAIISAAVAATCGAAIEVPS